MKGAEFRFTVQIKELCVSIHGEGKLLKAGVLIGRKATFFFDQRGGEWRSQRVVVRLQQIPLGMDKEPNAVRLRQNRSRP